MVDLGQRGGRDTTFLFLPKQQRHILAGFFVPKIIVESFVFYE